jgi:hypothetical protein
MALDRQKRGLISRYGLPLALIGLLGLATLSFVTMGALRDEPPASETDIEVPTKLTQVITDLPPTDETGSSEWSEDAAGAGDESGTMTTGTEAEPSPTVKAEQPVQPVVAPQAETAVEEKQPKPAKPAAAAADSKSAVPAPVEAETKEAGPPPPPFPAPGEPAPQGGDAPGSGETRSGMTIPKPLWQTVDQNWDKVTVEEGPSAAAADGEGSDFRQIGVGESVMSRPGDTTPLPPKAASRTAAETSEKTPADPDAVQTAKTAPKATAKTSSKPRRTTSSRPKRGASSSVAAARPGAGLELSIVNETGKPGQAEAYRDVLQAMGYKVGRIEDRAASGGDRTTIFYKTGREKQARTLAQRIPGQRRIAPAPPGAQQDIVIVVR